MRQLAERLKVSVSTVSLALSGNPNVAEATRRKVKDLAQELGFRPDPVLAALNRYRKVRQPEGQRDTLVLLMPRMEPGQPKNRRHWFQPFRNGIHDAAETMGYHLLEESLELESKTSLQLSRQLYHRGVKGLILGPANAELMQIDFDWDPFSVVATSLRLKKLGFHTVCSSARQATELALDQIVASARPPSVGFVLTRRGAANGEERQLGSFLTRQSLHPEQVGTLPICLLDDDDKKAMRQLERWFTRHAPKTILFGGGVLPLRMVENRKLRVPEDVALVGLEAEKYTQISGSIQPLYHTGVETVALLHSLLTRGEQGRPQHRKYVMIDCAWQNAGTL
jgi:DNA-binding LacI/PurR family transcriptional regulator